MYVKRTIDCPELVANDGCRLREVLHPKNDGIALPYSLAVAVVEPGRWSYRHRLAQTEVYYILEGGGIMHIDAASRPLCPGDAVVIPAGSLQWIENPGRNPLVFAAIVSPAWRAEDDARLE